MEQLLTIIKSRRIGITILAILLFCLALNGWILFTFLRDFLPETKIVFPSVPVEAEIVFTTEREDVWEVGFVNQDGSFVQYTYLPHRMSRLIWPTRNTILGIIPGPSGASTSTVRQVDGKIAYGEEGDGFNFVICEGVWGYEVMNYIDNEGSVAALVVNARSEISLIELNPCETRSTYLELNQYPNESLHGASISPDGSWIVYSIGTRENRTGTLFIQEVETQDATELTQGQNPAVSPNGEWISFIKDDGIYIIRPDGTDEHRLVDMEISIVGLHPMIEGIPYPRWSPDGEFLVYHDPPRGQFLYYPQDADICIVNIESNEIDTLIEGGTYPFWIGGR